MKKIILVIILFTFPILMIAQQATLKGKIMNSKNESISGASIFLPDTKKGVFSDSLGSFSINIPSEKRVKIIFSFAKTKTFKTIKLKNNEVFILSKPIIINNVLENVDVFGRSMTDLQTESIPKLPMPGPNNSVPKILTFTNFATSNNELSSNYNVRGGNYDENLIYVNGFEVFRPFLTRTGQQEGMSFIHTSLVKDIQFSAGGFASEFGDKLSSVLNIEYRKPEQFKGSFMASLLGTEAHIEGEYKNSRGYYLLGARFRSNGYLLNALPTQGEYNPVFYDVQFFTNVNVKEKLRMGFFGHFSSNDYRFIPTTKETSFGTVNQAFSLKIYYDGRESNLARTIFGGIKMEFDLSKNHKLSWFASAFNSNETENFDIQGQYFINELETDPNKENFGDSVNTLGIGTFLEHGRNRLQATIMNTYLKGQYQKLTKETKVKKFRYNLGYGIKAQREIFNDKLSEWNMIDSSGYSIPQAPQDKIILSETIKSRTHVFNNRFTAYSQNILTWEFNKPKLPLIFKQKRVYKNEKGKKIKETYYIKDTIFNSWSRFALNIGARVGYTTVNNDVWISPRIIMTYVPRSYLLKEGKVRRRVVKFRLSAGLYQQPPFYREMRNLSGKFNANVKNQKSFHTVLGTDVFFHMWNRKSPFKFTAEAYYKYLWDVNPYEIDNVRIRYSANNNAVAFAYGLDMKIHGQFIPGIESYFKLGFLSTKEDILNDFYVVNFNKDGEEIIPGFTLDDTITSSKTVSPGFIPRPTDQLFTIGMLFQDRMPKVEQLSVSLSGVFASKLPYGPPGHDRYKDTLRAPSYFRIDIGFQYDFLYRMKRKPKESRKKFWDKFDNIILSFEVFNLFGINNVISHRWVEDVSGRNYAVPNFLTSRRFNVKLNISW